MGRRQESEAPTLGQIVLYNTDRVDSRGGTVSYVAIVTAIDTAAVTAVAGVDRFGNGEAADEVSLAIFYPTSVQFKERVRRGLGPKRWSPL